MMLSDAEVFAASLEVQINGNTHDLRWPSDQFLLDVLFDAGISAPNSCKAGKCGACVCTITEGKVAMSYNEILEEEDVAEGYTLSCQSTPLTSNIKITFY